MYEDVHEDAFEKSQEVPSTDAEEPLKTTRDGLRVAKESLRRPPMFGEPINCNGASYPFNAVNYS